MPRPDNRRRTHDVTLAPESRIGSSRIDQVGDQVSGTTAYGAASPSGQVVAHKRVHVAVTEQPGFATRRQAIERQALAPIPADDDPHAAFRSALERASRSPGLV